MEKRLRLNFGQVDIYAKVGGGMKIQEPGMDLALVAAMLSSFYDVPLPERAVLWGEVDLNGQIRPVAAHDIRLSQARRLGYKPILFPSQGEGDGIATVVELQDRLVPPQELTAEAERASSRAARISTGPVLACGEKMHDAPLLLLRGPCERVIRNYSLFKRTIEP